MLGGLNPTYTSPNPRVRSQDAMILEANANEQCYDAMRDLRVKIRVLQMPLFKFILTGDMKVKIFVSTR
jgi:hypothetical protein